MTWNYRIIKSKDEHGEFFAIHEVYYDKNNNIVFYSTNPAHLTDETIEELKGDIELIKKAFELPVLNLEDLPG